MPEYAQSLNEALGPGSASDVDGPVRQICRTRCAETGGACSNAGWTSATRLARDMPPAELALYSRILRSYAGVSDVSSATALLMAVEFGWRWYRRNGTNALSGQ